LYASVRQTTGAEVVVDSSKSPAFALLLSTVSALDISFVHLVRDPRGVAYSWSRQKHSPDFPRHLDRQGPLTTAMKWVTWNAAAEALITTRPGRRSMRVRYEDFVSRPEGTLRAITKLVGTERDDLPLIDSSTARLGPAHTIGGNPIRFSAGTVKFSPDEEWQSRMSRSAWLGATGPALPLLLRYGYRVTSPARHVQGAT
jgi:hypothetical protein